MATRCEVATGLSVTSPADTQTHLTSGFPLLSLAESRTKFCFTTEFTFKRNKKSTF